MIDFAVKLNLFETPPYPEECKNAENKKECLSKFTTSFLFKNFNRLNLKGKGMLYAELSFFIDLKGKLSGLKVNGQNEVFNQALLAAMKNFPLLYPATKAGEKAPYSLTMPVYYGKN